MLSWLKGSKFLNAFFRLLLLEFRLTFIFRPKSVGWHSDVLSYLGPYCTIASLSLGVSRPFRLRLSAIPPPGSPSHRTLEIQLPHNSLLILHAGCQELFKHTIPEVKAVDSFKIWSGLEGVDEKIKDISFIERINVSFFYSCFKSTISYAKLLIRIHR